eukprot:3670705-Amphidinium_carterae.1
MRSPQAILPRHPWQEVSNSELAGTVLLIDFCSSVTACDTLNVCVRRWVQDGGACTRGGLVQTHASALLLTLGCPVRALVSLRALHVRLSK